MLRQRGHSFELSTVLCSILLGQGYNSYVVSGYANEDVTNRIMKRTPCPILQESELQEEPCDEVQENKYNLRIDNDLHSKFREMMQKREEYRLEQEVEEKKELERLENKRIEQRPFDEFHGFRMHSWVLVLQGSRGVEESFFLEPSTGVRHDLSYSGYLKIESVWNHVNYWVNLQEDAVKFDLGNTEHWEHLLVGEPIWEQVQETRGTIDEEAVSKDFLLEKHLDMPWSWSSPVNLQHSTLSKRFPGGSRRTFYNRAFVEEFAPYIHEDGLVLHVIRYEDFDCTRALSDEQKYENRSDKLRKCVENLITKEVVEYFDEGRLDCIKNHSFLRGSADRTLEFYSDVRHDGLEQIELVNNVSMILSFGGRFDKMVSTKVFYENDQISKITQQFEPNKNLEPSQDVGFRIFDLQDNSIEVRLQYVNDNMTASSRTFTKLKKEEFGDGYEFNLEDISGFKAELDKKPPGKAYYYQLFKKQLEERARCLNFVEQVTQEIESILLLRQEERLYPKLEVSVYNREQNVQNREAIEQMEQELLVLKEKEIVEKTDFLAPYLARIGSPEVLTKEQAEEIKALCLEDYKGLLVKRANSVLKVYTKTSQMLDELVNLHESPDEEVQFIEEQKELTFYLHTLELRLTRAQSLSSQKYEALESFLQNHPKLQVLLLS